MEIHGYTLHGDYYLTDEVITNTTWEQACKMKKEITLPNGKIVVAHTLSRKELETIPTDYLNNGIKGWYWTSTPRDDNYAWFMGDSIGFDYSYIHHSDDYGGVRLGFHKNEIKQLLDIE